ncbi:imelysin family protein [Paracoccaceae bacterium GXU_MW_L88]
MRYFLPALLAAAPALADVDRAIDEVILPATAQFAEASEALADAARADCTAEALRPAYQEAFDAWPAVSILTLGPLEQNGRKLAIAFWPDTRGMVQRTVADLLAAEDPVVDAPEEFAEVSVAGRGLFALERLLYGEDAPDYADGDYACALARAIAVDLARMASAIDAEWRDGFAETLRTAGAPENEVYLSEKEATQALYTALMTSLEFTADQQLGRPLGTFDRPRPERAEARRSERSKRNVQLALEAQRSMARGLADAPIPITEAAFDEAFEALDRVDSADFSDIDDPSARLKLEIVQQRVQTIRTDVAGEIGGALGVTAGFNSADGD